jgi:hypothetical protein
MLTPPRWIPGVGTNLLCERIADDGSSDTHKNQQRVGGRTLVTAQ